MSDWKTWGIHGWNEKLLAHFFERSEGQQTPVLTLLVTSEALARVSGDPSAVPEEVRAAFVRAVLSGIKHSKSLLESASDYPGWPGPPPRAAAPRFVAHLLLTCVAASESSEELGSEESFITRLRLLTDNQLPDQSLHNLPCLWKHLANWLEKNEQTYRRLVLPNPGAFTRIGHTIRLSFPDRRDQKLLSDLLDRVGLAGLEPPIGRVLSLVSSERSRFRSSFIAAFDEFRHLFHANDPRQAKHLLEHRFWEAVREASFHGRGYTDDIDSAVRTTLLAEEQDDNLTIFAVADESENIDEVGFVELPFAYGAWRFALMPAAETNLETDGLQQTVMSILGQTLRLPRVSSQVGQGVLPFVDATHGLLELAARDQLADASFVLVRQELLDDFVRLVCPGAHVRKSIYQGWVQIPNPSLRTVSFSELNGTTLEKTWILQESLSPISIRIVGGVRADDAWLGVHETLPRIVASGVSEMIMEGPAGRESLERIDDTSWKLPIRDLNGEITLLALLDGRVESRRTIRFVSAPVSEAFKMPSEPGAWIVERMGTTVALSDTSPFTDAFGEIDCQGLCERVAYLEANVGAFCSSAESAIWQVVNFGKKFVGARGLGYEQGARPESQIASANARSRWRTMLFKSVPSWSDEGFEAARRNVKGRACSQDLPKIDREQVVPEMNSLRLQTPSERASRLVRVLAGRASSRAGVVWRDWAELALGVLHIERTRLESITRAWMEAGLIDVAASARWRHQVIFARRPLLVGYKVGEFTGATLTGLVLPTTRDEVQKAAARMGALAEERFSVSDCVPSTVTFRLRNVRQLEELGKACGIKIQGLDLRTLSGRTLGQHDVNSMPPGHYELSNRWSRWSLLDGEQHQRVEFKHFIRPDRPDYWQVCCDGKRVWSYSLNAARSWAAALIDSPILRLPAGPYLETSHAYLPLPLARTIGVLGSGLAGPTSVGTYQYPICSSELRQIVIDVLSRTFDCSRLTILNSVEDRGSYV